MTKFNEDEPLLDGEWPAEAFRVPHASPGLREALRGRTARAVRRRPWRRRAGWALAVAGAYAFGLWMGGAPHPEHVTPQSVVPLQAAAPKPERAPVPAEVAQAAAPDPVRDPEAFALYLERLPREQQLDVLREAGDHYLNEQGDVQRALSFYRQLLTRATPDYCRRFDVDESWLLRSLKQDRLREVSHEGNA